jgi:hypothetical protein
VLLDKVFGESEEAPAKWFTWKEGKDEDGKVAEKLELQIAPIPPSDRSRIRARHLGKKRRMLLTDRGLAQEQDIEAQQAARREMVAFCLRDSRGFTFPAGPALAEKLASLGLAPDEEGHFTLDGKWTAAVKDTMLRSYIGDSLGTFVDETVTKMLGEDEEEEEEARGN